MLAGGADNAYGVPHLLCFSRLRVLRFGGSPIGFAAVFHGGDAYGVSLAMEADAVVADAEAELGRLDVLEALDVAFAGLQIAGQRLEDTEGGGLIDDPELRLGLVAPDYAFAHALAIRFVRVGRGAAHALEVFEGEAELGQHLLVRNALAAVEGVASSSDLTGLVLRHRFIVQRSVGEAAGDGIEDSFEQADDGGKLCRGKPVNQFVGVLFGVGHESSSPLILT